MKLDKHTVLLLIILCILCSCEKIFHQEETSIGIIDSYEESVSATEGVYGKLTSAFNYSDVFGFHNPNLKGDDLNAAWPEYSFYYGEECENYDWIYDDEYIRHQADLWKSLYQVIISANNIINQYHDCSALDILVQEVLGEVYFIRAYCYFRLTRTYGQIPLIHDIEIDYSIEKASFTNIYEYIKNDLEMAKLLLPDNTNSARKPFITPHRGTAKALLAEVFMYWAGYPIHDAEKYIDAVLEAGEVIDSADYFGFDLLADFSWLWDKDHYYNSESVFCLYYADPSISSNLEVLNRIYRGHAEVYQSFYTLKTGPGSPGLRLFFFGAEINFYNDFPQGYRKDITFYSTIYVPDDYPYYPQIDTGYIHIDSMNTCSRPGYRKFYFEPDVVAFEQYNSSETGIFLYFGTRKVYLYRFAHTLLTYAEAAARSGQLNEKAYECVNRIRRRANNVDINTPSVYDLQPDLSPEAFADSVVWERAWELAGEPEGRWFDLVRLEMVEDLPNLRNPDEGGPPYSFDKSEYFFPIPASDTLLNPNLGNN